MNFGSLTATEIHELVTSGQVSATELTSQVLDQIGRLNSSLNCFISTCEDYSLKLAEEIERKLTVGDNPGRLAGVPLAIKDNICVKDLPLTCASEILDGYISPYHATAVEKLTAEGAIIVGKTNLDEFGMGSSNEYSRHGRVKNPLDHDRVTGGSSGGSAASVAADLVPLALGTDSGGSVRQPASLCGIYGLRPTYGTVSRYGLVEFGSSFDQIGPLARNLTDLELIYSIISGCDERDATSLDYEYGHTNNTGAKSAQLKVGVISEYYDFDYQPEVKDCLNKMAELLENCDCEIIEVSLPHSDLALSCYYVLANAEASSNLARYDGVRYGRRTTGDQSLAGMYCRTRGQGFGPEVRRRIMLGTYVLSSGYYEAWYLKARQAKKLIRADFEQAFKLVDLILAPTSPTTAFKAGEKTVNPLDMYLADLFTIPPVLAGLPALSIPAGADKLGLPIGMQLSASRFREDLLFSVAHRLEELGGGGGE